jgi:HAMP domain-containing protein
MLVICENCGKKYRLDPTILGRKPVKFKYKSCTRLIMLPGTQNSGGYTDDMMQRRYAAPAVTTWNDPGSSLPHGSNDGRDTKVEGVEDNKMYAPAHDVLTAVPGTTVPAVSDAIPAVFSLRSKILFFFAVLPLILFASSSVLFLYQTIRLEHALTGESTAIITRMAEAKISHSEDLIQPVTALRSRPQSLTGRIKTTIAIILSRTLLIMGATVSIFACRLTRKVRSLTDAADRISIGDLEVDIPIRSKDELGKLAEAISRMQDSIRLSIERLKRR